MNTFTLPIDPIEYRLSDLLPNGRIKPERISDLSCRYCGKTLSNENAHSGHMGSCTKRLRILKAFRQENRAIFRNEEEALNRWNSLDHSYFELFEYEIRFSVEAIQFIHMQVDALTRLPEARLEKYCLFYLVVLAQIADTKTVRLQAFELLKGLLPENELKLLLKYWKKLGSKRYEPSTEAYATTWSKFVRVKDDCFFYVDYTVWLLLLDRYILTYPNFGWTANNRHKENLTFMDAVLHTAKEILYLEQDSIGLPGSVCFQSHVPAEVIPLLHPNSRQRFSKVDLQWITVSKIGYDPRDPASAMVI